MSFCTHIYWFYLPIHQLSYWCQTFFSSSWTSLSSLFFQRRCLLNIFFSTTNPLYSACLPPSLLPFLMNGLHWCFLLVPTFFTLLATSFSHWHHLSLLTSKQFFIQTLTGKTNVWNMKGRLMLTLNTAIICSVFAESAESAHLYITHSGSEGSNGIYKFGTNRLAPANHDKGI